jgi:hypothetical protein
MRPTKTYVDDNDLPVRLFLVQEGHHTENLDLLDLTCVANKFADFAHVQRVIVALRFGLGVYDVGVFPGLMPISVKDALSVLNPTHSWESTIVPQIALVGEAVADESELAFLDILLDGVPRATMSVRGVLGLHEGGVRHTGIRLWRSKQMRQCLLSGERSY